jgi:acetylornithine/N-succinyldiaminopimelate aminotransferase
MLTNRQLFLLHLGQTSDEPLMLEISKAEGVFMYSPSGEKYLDLISGVSVSNTGHRHPRVTEAIREQTDAYLHLMVYGEIIQSPQVKYAQLISSILPDSLSSCYFVNSGSEAVEGALKLAKRFTGRTKIIYFTNSYHGSTHGALSVQGSEKFRDAFRPLLPDTLMLPFNDFSSLDAIDNRTACVIIEPVQGEAGVIYPAEGYLEEIRRRCTGNKALLIFDEAQTGLGRTGLMFAFERYGIKPDILVLAKALGGGMPLGAFISSKEIMSSLLINPQLGHITTFGGHPVCCAAGLASLKVIIEENLVGQCTGKASAFKEQLVHPLIKEVRGEGLLLAVKLSDPRYVRYAIKHAPDHGIILDYFLFCDDAFRIAPPLIINREEILMACRQVKSLLDDVMKNIGKE